MPNITPPLPPTDTGLDDTDGRDKFDCKSKYPEDAKSEIRCETIFLFTLLFSSLIALYLVWVGYVGSWLGLSGEEGLIFRKYALFATSGLIGGITFGMKYFYRVVARGYWHQDRKAWRIMSPFVSMIIALITGTLVNTNMVSGQEMTSGASTLAIGFLAGYFADEAVGKMYEVANVIFGRTSQFFRKLLASRVGCPSMANYRDFPFLNNAKNTSQAFVEHVI